MRKREGPKIDTGGKSGMGDNCGIIVKPAKWQQVKTDRFEKCKMPNQAMRADTPGKNGKTSRAAKW